MPFWLFVDANRLTRAAFSRCCRFRVDAQKLNHLDTDVALAFPTQDPTMHPNYHQFTTQFSADPTLFLLVFLASLEKMSLLGVSADVTLSFPGNCNPGCFAGSNRRSRGLRSNAGVSDPEFRLLETEAPLKFPAKRPTMLSMQDMMKLRQNIGAVSSDKSSSNKQGSNNKANFPQRGFDENGRKTQNQRLAELKDFSNSKPRRANQFYSPTQMIVLLNGLKKAAAKAEVGNRADQAKRQQEIKAFTTPVRRVRPTGDEP